MADEGGSSSSEDGFEPMEVNIPPNLARELGQVPGMTEGDGGTTEKIEQVPGEEEEGSVMEEDDTLDLKKISADYAQYLAVNSRQDVSLL